MTGKHLIILLGPTGVGKTGTSIALSHRFNAPVLSADSRQFFREMRIGTAAPTAEQLSNAPHHLIGHKSIADRYSCGMFELEALSLLDEVFETHGVAMLVGGSMLYIDAVCKGIDDFPAPDPELRKALEKQLEEEGLESLRAQLKLLDPEYYHQIDIRNSKRVLKAIEVCLQTGKPYSSFLTSPKKERQFNTIKIGLNRPREELYSMINARVDKMINDGLVEEAKGVYQYRNLNALKTVGYREIFEFLDGKITLDKAIELVKRNSRHYAKRQLTWWARDKDIEWFHPEAVEDIVNHIHSITSK